MTESLRQARAILPDPYQSRLSICSLRFLPLTEVEIRFPTAEISIVFQTFAGAGLGSDFL